MVSAICKEIASGDDFIPADSIIETIYFGGGTPSILQTDELRKIFSSLQRYNIPPGAEVTLEANPDDITPAAAEEWLNLGINRLSIGIQSFSAEELRWMNRAHNAQQAEECLRIAKQSGFSNYSADLIFGSPLQTDEVLDHNLNTMVKYGVPHLSCYALTIEPRTVLHNRIEKRLTPNVSSQQQADQFYRVMDFLTASGYDHYEISNYALPVMRSKHNSAYWKGTPYLGFGPAAHSFNGNNIRRWNISNNTLYIQKINALQPAYESETLTLKDAWNEWIMIGLRTKEGISQKQGESRFGKERIMQLQRDAIPFIERGHLVLTDDHLCLTRAGKILADGIAADLFMD